MKEQMDLLIIMPDDEEQIYNERQQQILQQAIEGYTVEIWRKADDFVPVQDRRILFVLNLGADGINVEYQRLLRKMRQQPDCLKGCVGSILVDADSELYTKAEARELVFAANLCGCMFPGKPMVEGTASLDNFLIQARNLDTDRMGAYQQMAKNLITQLMEFQLPLHERPKVLAVHASNRATSNTLTLWRKVKQHIEHDCDVQEISLQNGSVMDCNGCPYQTCRHFGETYSCFYGGVIVEEVYPAILDCDALVILCPNYNDAVSANLSAFINRLTALFSKTRFYNKAVFSIVVSGYSGGDIVSKQIMGALNMNKTFLLPANFSLMATANDPFSVNKITDIDQRAEAFAQNMLHHLKRNVTIHIIAAVANNQVIGNNGGIPWQIPADLQHFKELTMGNTVIMGRRTYESIGRPLSGRQNIVVTTTMDNIDGCQIARSLNEALSIAKSQEIFIIGGAKLYDEALPLADVLDLTLVDAEPQGDTLFPTVDWSCFEEVQRQAHIGDPAYCYVTYRKK